MNFPESHFFTWVVLPALVFFARDLDVSIGTLRQCCYLAYAGGFAMGNYVGMLIENRLAIGQLVVRIITGPDFRKLLDQLKSAGYIVTLVDGQGLTGPVKILFTVIKRRQLNRIVPMITELAPQAFYSVEDVQNAREAVIPPVPPHQKNYYWQLWKMSRKRK